MTKPFQADPLTPEQRAEVLRVMNDSRDSETRNLRIALAAEQHFARQRAKDHPAEAEKHRAVADAFGRALDLVAVMIGELPLSCTSGTEVSP